MERSTREITESLTIGDASLAPRLHKSFHQRLKHISAFRNSNYDFLDGFYGLGTLPYSDFAGLLVCLLKDASEDDEEELPTPEVEQTEVKPTTEVSEKRS